jgi:hypothetical protein
MRCIYFLLYLVSASTCFGFIGDSKVEMEAKYGAGEADSYSVVPDQLTYHSNGLTLTVQYIDGFAEKIEIEKRGKTSISDAEIHNLIVQHLYKDSTIDWKIFPLSPGYAFRSIEPSDFKKLPVYLMYYVDACCLSGDSDIFVAYTDKKFREAASEAKAEATQK